MCAALSHAAAVEWPTHPTGRVDARTHRLMALGGDRVPDARSLRAEKFLTFTKESPLKAMNSQMLEIIRGVPKQSRATYASGIGKQNGQSGASSGRIRLAW